VPEGCQINTEQNADYIITLKKRTKVSYKNVEQLFTETVHSNGYNIVLIRQESRPRAGGNSPLFND